jgi:hypothetical protein
VPQFIQALIQFCKSDEFDITRRFKKRGDIQIGRVDRRLPCIPCNLRCRK